MNTTFEQKQLMIEWMKLHPDVATGRLRRKGQSRHEMNKLLEVLAAKLNLLEGPVKTGAEWFKTWKDWKNYILKKETKRRSYCNGTGGGPPLKIQFSAIEEEVLEFLTPEAVGLENIPQGGLYVNLPESDSCNVQEEVLENIENVPPPRKRCNSETTTISNNLTSMVYCLYLYRVNTSTCANFLPYD